MFAKYKNHIYTYITSRRRKEIVTRNQYKADCSFYKDGDVFYKSISEDDLTDIFKVEFWVGYDAHLLNVPHLWKVGYEEGDYVDGKILLRFAEGILPGWKTEEKNVCVKHVDINEIEEVMVIYLYKKKDDEICIPPKKVEEKITIDKILSLFDEYKRLNI